MPREAAGYKSAVEFLPDARLREVVSGLNPWWTSGTLPPRPGRAGPHRVDARRKKDDRPLLLCGPRRCGKTSTIYRWIGAHLGEAGDPREIVYLDLDHALLRLEPLGPLVDRVLKLAASSSADTGRRPTLFLDGLQTIPDWPARFKEVVETRPHPRIVGAAAMHPGNEENSYETVTLTPMRLREFAESRGLPDLKLPALDLLEPEAPTEKDSAEEHLFDRVLDPLLADYLVRGGFPEAALAHDLRSAQAIVRDSVVSRAIYQDLPAVVGVMKLADVERVLIAALLKGGEPIQAEAFADALELDRQTVARYVEHLSRAFLLSSLKNYAAATDRSRARMTPGDPSLANALLERGATVLAQPEPRRELLVSAVLGHVQDHVRERGFDLAYFKEGELECDLVVVTPDGAIPLLVVDRDEVTEEEAAIVERLIKRFKVRHCFVLSRSGPRRREPVSFFESVIHLPAAYFLYALDA